MDATCESFLSASGKTSPGRHNHKNVATFPRISFPLMPIKLSPRHLEQYFSGRMHRYEYIVLYARCKLEQCSKKGLHSEMNRRSLLLKLGFLEIFNSPTTSLSHFSHPFLNFITSDSNLDHGSDTACQIVKSARGPWRLL